MSDAVVAVDHPELTQLIRDLERLTATKSCPDYVRRSYVAWAATRGA